MIVYSRDLLRMIVAELRSRGRVIVLAPGCFDLLHVGHVETLRLARRHGDFLIAATNTDKSISRAKGPSRPIVPLADRVAMLDSLRCVDAVVPYDEDTPEILCRIIRPDIMVKGEQYAGQHLPGEEHCGRVILSPMVANVSTTRITEEIAARRRG